jgi:hypothetical protein
MVRRRNGHGRRDALECSEDEEAVLVVDYEMETLVALLCGAERRTEGRDEEEDGERDEPAFEYVLSGVQIGQATGEEEEPAQ